MINVVVEQAIDAPISAVWAVVRDFGGLAIWHPDVATCALDPQNEPSIVGAIRSMTMHGLDGCVREKLLELSNETYELIYTLLDSPAPITDYRGVIKLTPATHQTIVCWSATYSVPVGLEDQFKSFSIGVFQRGIDALGNILSAKNNRVVL